eukprot:395328-Prorocentrum_minimum.AAC.1
MSKWVNGSKRTLIGRGFVSTNPFTDIQHGTLFLVDDGIGRGGAGITAASSLSPLIERVVLKQLQQFNSSLEEETNQSNFNDDDRSFMISASCARSDGEPSSSPK